MATVHVESLRVLAVPRRLPHVESLRLLTVPQRHPHVESLTVTVDGDEATPVNATADTSLYHGHVDVLVGEGPTSLYHGHVDVLVGEGPTSLYDGHLQVLFATNGIPLRPLFLPMRGVGTVVPYSGEVLADSPLAYWRFETVAFTEDSSGNGRTLTEVTSPTPGQDPVINEGNGALLDTSDCFYIDDASIGALTTYTWECWFRPTATSSGSIAQIMGFQWTSGHSIPVSIQQKGSSISFEVFTGSAWVSIHTFTQEVGANYHLAMVRDGTAYEAFVNGTSVGTATISPSTTVRPFVRLGQRWDNAEYVRGVLDEAAIYPTALSSERIAAHYAAGSV